MVGIDVPIVNVVHQYLVTEDLDAVAALEREPPVVRDPRASCYYRQEQRGLIVGPYETDGAAALGARRDRLVLRRRAAAARHRPPDAVARAGRQAHPGVRACRHQAGRQRAHHPHAGWRVSHRPGGGAGDFLAVLRRRNRHHPGAGRGQVPGAVDGPRPDRDQRARDGGETLRQVVDGALQPVQGGGRIPPDVPGALSRRVPGRGPPGADHADPRQARGTRRRLRRDLRLGAGEVVRTPRGRGALRLSPHELVRRGRRGMPGGARARRRAGSLGLRQVRRRRARRRRVPRPHRRQPDTAERPDRPRPRPDRARRHRERVHRDAAGRGPVLPALGLGRADPRLRLAGAAPARIRGRRDRRRDRRLRRARRGRSALARAARRADRRGPRQRGVPVAVGARDRGRGRAGTGAPGVLCRRARLGASPADEPHGRGL